MSAPARRCTGAVTAGLYTAAALVPLNSTMIAVALLDIERDFDIGVGAVTWLVSGYLVVMALVQPVGGRIGDALGHRRAFLTGLVAFIAVSTLATFANWFAALAVLRMTQALCGGLVLPAAAALLREIAPPERRGRMFGWFATVMGLAAAVGPVLGGVLVAAFGWHAIFLVNLPVGAIALTLAVRALPRDETRPAAAAVTFDLAGAAVFTGFMVTLVAALLRATEGVAQWLPAAVGAAVLLAVFVAIERRRPHPFVSPSLFRHRAYTAATTTVFLHNLVLYSLLLIVPIIAERELGLGPSGAGLLIGAMTLAMMVSSPVGGHMSDGLGRRTPVMVGGAIAVLATVGLVLVSRAPGAATTAVLVALAGAGVGIASASLQTTAVESAPAGMVGVASGVFMTVRYTGAIAATGLTASVAASDAFGAGFVVLASAAALSLATASALAARPAREAAVSA